MFEDAVQVMKCVCVPVYNNAKHTLSNKTLPLDVLTDHVI